MYGTEGKFVLVRLTRRATLCTCQLVSDWLKQTTFRTRQEKEKRKKNKKRKTIPEVFREMHLATVEKCVYVHIALCHP